jgi:hypothetical protein
MAPINPIRDPSDGCTLQENRRTHVALIVYVVVYIVSTTAKIWRCDAIRPRNVPCAHARAKAATGEAVADIGEIFNRRGTQTSLDDWLLAVQARVDEDAVGDDATERAARRDPHLPMETNEKVSAFAFGLVRSHLSDGHEREEARVRGPEGGRRLTCPIDMKEKRLWISSRPVYVESCSAHLWTTA